MNAKELINHEKTQTDLPYSYHQLAIAVYLGLDTLSHSGRHEFHNEGSLGHPQEGDIREAREGYIPDGDAWEGRGESALYEVNDKLYAVYNDDFDGDTVDLSELHVIDPNWDTLKFRIQEIDYSDYADLEDELSALRFHIGEIAIDDGFVDSGRVLKLRAVERAIIARAKAKELTNQELAVLIAEKAANDEIIIFTGMDGNHCVTPDIVSVNMNGNAIQISTKEEL